MTTRLSIASLSAFTFAVAVPTARAAQPASPDEAFKSQMLPLIEFLMAKCAEFGWGLIALGFLAVLLVGFFAAWGVSKLLARDASTFSNALRYYLLGLLSTTVLLGITFGSIWYAISSHSFGLALGVIALACLAGIIVNFAIPMKIYQIGIIRALFFNILVAIAAGIGQGVLEVALPGPFDDLRSKSPEEQQRLVREWHMKTRENELNAQSPVQAPSLTPAQRVQQMHDQLQIERATLDLNDQPAVIAFNQRVAEYNAVKAQFAQPAATTPAVLTPTSTSAKGSNQPKTKEK